MTTIVEPRAPALRDLADRTPRQAHGCAVGILAAVALYGGIQAQSWLLPRSGISVGVAAVVLALVALARRPRAPVFERVFVPIALVPTAAAIAWAAYLEVAWPVVHLEAHGAWGVEFIGAFVWSVPVLAFAAAILGGIVARRLTAAHARPLRGLAWAAVLASAALLVSGARRSETAEGYLTRLPVIATIPAPPSGAGAGWSDDRSFGDLRVRRVVDAPSRCLLFLSSRPGDKPQPAWRDPGCAPLVVRADDAHGVWVLEGLDHFRTWYRGASSRVRGAYPQSVAGPLRPANAYLALAALGALVGILSLSVRRRSRLETEEKSWREGTVGTDGMLSLGDGTPPLALPGGISVPEGPVVVLLKEPAGSFREPAGPLVMDVVPGTLAEHGLARLELPAFALAFVVIAVTPLAVAILSTR